MTDTSTLPYRLMALRECKGVTLREAAEHIDVDYHTLWFYEMGRTLPNADKIVRLCRYYGVSADWLLGLEGES